jgi:tetratricopeptide (TPR) repeat protein
MLKGVGPSVAHGKDTAVLREILDRTDEQISTGLTNQPKVEAEIRNLIGGLYLDIGNYDRAENSLRAAAAIDRKLYGVESAQAAKSRHELSVALFKQGKLAEAESTELEALAIRRRFFGNENEDVAISLCNLADVYRLQRRVAEAVGLTQEALRIRQKLFGDDSLQAANSLRSLCILLGDKGERPESAAMAEKVLAIRIKHLGTNDLLVAASLDDLAWADDYVGKLKEAESLELEALEIRRKLLGDVHPDVASSLSYLGQFMRNQGKLSDSDTVLSATYAIQCKLEGENNPQTLYTLDALGATLNKEGKWTEAKTVFSKSLSTWRKQQGNSGPRALWALQGLVDALVGEKKYDEAATALSEVLTPEYVKEPASADLLWKEADLLGQQGKWQEALTNAAFLLKYQPNDEYGYHVCCGLLAVTRNTLAYQQLCQRILATFTNSTSPYLAERVADDGLLLPGSGADLRVLDKWATDAVVLGKNSPDHGYFEACKAFSDYRSGRFPESATWAEKSLDTSAAFAKAKAYAVLAMARWQLGQKDAARDALAQGNELAQPISASGKAVYLGSSWVAWIFARVTLDEATELIGRASNRANRSNGTQ